MKIRFKKEKKEQAQPIFAPDLTPEGIIKQHIQNNLEGNTINGAKLEEAITLGLNAQENKYKRIILEYKTAVEELAAENEKLKTSLQTIANNFKND